MTYQDISHRLDGMRQADPVFHIGVDLAWGLRQPTGLAVLDDSGRLVHVSAVRTDEEVLTALAPYVGGPCLVAFDAPLVVRNATGNRPAEAALNKDFARFDAGAHPANTGKPELDPPRGAGLCGAMGLDLNPRSGRDRRAIEVYPHPATVALFRLGRTLKYKQKPGRDLDQLRAELLVLISHLEALRTARALAGPRHRRVAPAPRRRRVVRAEERAAGRRGPGRRRRLRLRRPLRRRPPRRHHHLRRRPGRLHRHADPAGGPRADTSQQGRSSRRTHGPG